MNPGRESYAKVVGNLVSILAGIVALAAIMVFGNPASKFENDKRPAPPLLATKPAVVKDQAPSVVATPPPAKPNAKPKPKAKPQPAPAPPELDREAIAKAESELDSLSRNRARADARADAAARRLSEASIKASSDAQRVKKLAFKVRDPSARIASASTRGQAYKGEVDKLKKEVASLATIPRPIGKVLANKNPVARPAEGNEQHFELRHNKVAAVDLDRLIAMVKTDAQLRIRLNDGARIVSSKVGPVGAFSLQYSLMRGTFMPLDDLMDRRGASYDLRGWEVVPEFENRGEPYEATSRPISDYARTINKLSPTRDTVTLWIYPDSFTLFRKLRDDLQAKGFLVAARPLPEGMAIRGSPSGSLSAGQ